MAQRRYNPRLAKIHRSYTVEEVAALYDVHKNTVRTWIKNGLLTCDNKRPVLILGQQLQEFLIRKRKKNKASCPPGTIYCVSCKTPQNPAGGIVKYLPTSDTRGMLIATCPCCGHRINRIANFSKIGQFNLDFEVTIKMLEKGLSNSFEPFINSDFNSEKIA